MTELRPSGDPLIYRNHVNGDRGVPPPAPPVSSFRSMYHNEPKRPSSGLIRQVMEGIFGNRFGREGRGGGGWFGGLFDFLEFRNRRKKACTCLYECVCVCVCV